MMRSSPSSRARARGLDAADAAIHRDHQPRAVGVQPIERRRLQPVAVAQPLGNEVHDVGAEQLERAAQDHGRGDAVDVVVAVDGDALLAGDRAEDAIDGRPPCPPARTGRAGRRATAPGTAGPSSSSPRPRMHSSRAVTGRQPSSRASDVAPGARRTPRACQMRGVIAAHLSLPSSPTLPIARHFRYRASRRVARVHAPTPPPARVRAPCRAASPPARGSCARRRAAPARSRR